MTAVWLAATARRRLLTVLLVLATGSCNNKCTGERDEVELPELDHIEINPAVLSAPVGVPFTLVIRLRDEHGSLLPFDPTASRRWTLGPHLTELDQDGPQILVRGDVGAAEAASPASFPTTIKVTVGGHSATANINLIVSAADAGDDWIQVGHVPKSPPAIAVIDGMTGGSWRNDTALAFVSEAPIGDYRQHTQSGNSGRVALFSTDHQMGYADAAWTDHQDRVVLPSPALAAITATPAPLTNQALGQPLAVPVAIWIAATGDAVPATVRADVDYAYRVFRETRSGLTLDTTLVGVFPAGVTLNVAAPDWTCPPDVVSQMLEAGVPAAAMTTPRVNVVYVTDFLNRPGWRGYACPADAAHGILVFVSFADRVKSTLAHELAHALSQWGKKFFGHYDKLSGTDPANLMWSGERDDAPLSRGQLTIGQMFQLSADVRAVVNVTGKRTGLKTETCQPDPATAVPCPQLTKDAP